MEISESKSSPGPWTLAWLAVAWTAGLLTSGQAGLSAWGWILLAVIALLALGLFRRHAAQRRFFALVMMFALGAARMQAALTAAEQQQVAAYNDLPGRVELVGVIRDSPDVRDRYTGLRLSIETIKLPSERSELAISGRVLAWAPRFGDWAYGDRVRVYGRLETPPVFEDFSYQDYLAREGIHSLMRNPQIERLASRQGSPVMQAIFDFRARAHKTVSQVFPDPEASLLSGILLGLEKGIPDEVLEDFNRTGTTHIIAISGFNITIVAGLFTRLFGRALGSRAGALTAALAIGVYTILVGADAAVVRAALMGGLALIARQVGRTGHGLAALAAAGLAMTAVNPLLLGDVGFQLSFAATLGLVLYAEPLKRWFVGLAGRMVGQERAIGLATPVGEYLLYTFAAQVTTLPLMMFHFQRLSVISWLANPAILPLQPAVMVLGGLAVLLGLIWLPLGHALAWVAWPFVAITIRVVEFFADLPLVSLSLGQVTVAVVLSCYLVLFALTLWGRTLMERGGALLQRRPLRGLMTVGLALAASLAWKAHVDRPDGLLHVTILNVGGGEAVLVESPLGRRVLIEGGASPMALSDALGRRLPLFARRIDWLFLGVNQDERIAGLAGVAERFSIEGAMLAGAPGGAAYRQLVRDLVARDCRIVSAAAGQRLDLGGGVILKVLETGERGAGLLIEHGWLRMLMVPGADPALILRLTSLPEAREAQVLLLPEGGYRPVNPASWLASVNPWLVLVSVEAGNRAGLPPAQVVEDLEGVVILRTDRHGWIELRSDGRQLWAQVERLPP